MILNRRMIKKGQRAGVEMLVQWKGMASEDATWVDRDELKRRFPTLEGKLFSSGEICDGLERDPSL
ncbi:hypothetical protein Pint_14056 [Pistacia integerrima]|uniref:Uncharacterized protein n=1 Tax=Pistacia integerrima TaxID=434235 RepID=A0ACC0Y716_9ROSI|nr:hypothetical protein Pint_14056 [Pistacia integerrima]